MGKSGGGSVDTSGLEEATKEATALQKQIYEETREDVQPWYNMGTGAVSKLSDLLGISGGSIQDRDAIYNEMLPQYTQDSTGASPGMWQDKSGRLYASEDEAYNAVLSGLRSKNNPSYSGIDAARARNSISEYMPASSPVTDFEALNAAVDARYDAQSAETPEDYGSLLQSFGMDQYQEDPGYQFRLDEANKALERQMAAQGVTVGGAGYGELNPQAYRAMTDLNQNLASQEYGNAYNRYVSDQLNTFNMLMGASGSGQQVTNQMGAAGQAYSTNVGNLTTSLANAQYQAAQAQASQPGMFGSLLGAGSMIGSALIMKSDIRVKESIIDLGERENGHKLYEFSYKGNPKRYIGVMAQDIAETNPSAVKEIDGVLHVDYGQLGVKMREA